MHLILNSSKFLSDLSTGYHAHIIEIPENFLKGSWKDIENWNKDSKS